MLIASCMATSCPFPHHSSSQSYFIFQHRIAGRGSAILHFIHIREKNTLLSTPYHPHHVARNSSILHSFRSGPIPRHKTIRSSSSSSTTLRRTFTTAGASTRTPLIRLILTDCAGNCAIAASTFPEHILTN